MLTIVQVISINRKVVVVLQNLAEGSMTSPATDSIGRIYSNNIP